MLILVFKYFFVALIFLLHSLLELESACLELKECRIRESKVLAKRKIKRLRKNILLSLARPLRIIRVLREIKPHIRNK